MSNERDKALAFVASLEKAVEAGYSKVMSMLDEVKRGIDELDDQNNATNSDNPDVKTMINDIASEWDARNGRPSAWRTVNPDLYTTAAGLRMLRQRWEAVPPEFKGGNVKGSSEVPTSGLLDNLGKLKRDLGL